ncbi:DUF3667 domain-containing protein [Flavobacteriaceae bacterium TK19130]|nr:DUF3667 domain-containing protein [Thermobacterium salinum]
MAPNHAYCSDCGAKVIDERLSVRGFATETTHAFFSLDTNKPIKTFVCLFTDPEDVIGGYISGVRKKYINPFGYLTIAITLFGLFLFFFKDNYSQGMEAVSGMTAQQDFQSELNRSINEFVLKYQSIIFFLSIPFLSILSLLTFYTLKKYNYAEHLVINMYSQAQVSIFSTILYASTVWFQDIFKIVALIITPLNILYFAFVFKKLHGISIGGILLRTLLFLALLIPLFIVAVIVMWAFLIFSGQVDMEQLREMQQAGQAMAIWLPRP